MTCPIECSKARFAVAAVREAAQIVRRVQRELTVAALAKDDLSPVTVADFAAQAIVAKRLGDTFPAMGFVGEEDAAALRQPAGRETLEAIARFVRTAEPTATPEAVCEWIDRSGEPTAEFWTLDPVDGTKGFLRGDQFAVALALIRDGQVRVGALACPELADGARPDKGGAGSLLVARRGDGCFVATLDGDGEGPWRKLAVSTQSNVAQLRLLQSVEKSHTDTGGIGAIVKMLGVVAPPVPMDSQAKYAVLAAGGGEALLRLLSPSRPDYREKIWDQAAGSIVIEEAGGRVTDLDGKPLDFSRGKTLAANRGVVATNGPVHEALLAALRRVGA